MTERVCDIAECTFSQTGVCMRSYSAPEQCPDHQAALARLYGEEPALDEQSDADGSFLEGTTARPPGEPVLTAPAHRPSIPRSGTLGLREADALMASRYVNLIGLVGLPNAGKTACVASLYLLLAHGALNGFGYADSHTLMALDEIARGSRRWNDGQPPNQMTVHTELADDRQAGFLHLRLRRDADGRKLDLLMPDLPGEWSRTLIDSGDGHRFEFLKAAEVVWLMVDGRDFVDQKTRQLAIHQTTNLIERLASVLPITRPRIILVASWRDMGDFPQAAFERVQEHGKSLGFDIEFASIASFSDNADVPPGIGLAELLSKTLAAQTIRPNPWPTDGARRSIRAFLNFGNH